MPSIGPSNSQPEARRSWVSFYPFEPYAGGQGCSLACSTSSSRVALVGISSAPNVAVIVNTGQNFAFVAFGNSSVVATTSCMAIPPGGAATITIYNEETPLPTNIAGITASGAATIQVTLGYGN